MSELKVKYFCKKDKWAEFSFYRQGYLYYEIDAWIPKSDEVYWNGQIQTFAFPVEIQDLDGATVNRLEKSVTMMRFIRKAIEDGTMVRTYPVPDKLL